MLGIAEKRYTSFHSGGRRTPLFWVSPGSVQHDVIRSLGPDQRIYGLRMTKLDPSRPPMTFSQIADFHIESLRGVQPRGPYALTGYCIAAIIAREMALKLAGQGEKISGLIMIDPPEAAFSRADLVKDPLHFKIRYNFHRMLFHLRSIQGMNFEQKAAYVRQSFRAIGVRMGRSGTRDVYEEHLRSGEALPHEILDIHKNNVHAFMNHTPARYTGAAYMLRPAVKPNGAFDYMNRRWEQLLGKVEYRDVPGTSITMWRKPQARAMADEIRSCMARIYPVDDRPVQARQEEPVHSNAS